MLARMGDLVGAFPKTWRELVVLLARLEAQVMGSRLLLLKEFLRHTAVEVSYSGRSILDTSAGLPEGGMLGPLCYPLVPLLLDKALAAAGAGVGVDIPAQSFCGHGGLNALQKESEGVLAGLDNEAQLRLHISLIADDQCMQQRL